MLHDALHVYQSSMKWFAANFRLASTCTCICHVWCWGFESGALWYLYNSVQGDDVARVLQSDRLVRSQTTVASLCRLPKEVHVQHKARAPVQAYHVWVLEEVTNEYHILQQNTHCMHLGKVLHYGLGQFSHQKLVLRGCIMRFIVEIT